jgi:hypothetical protein
MKDPVFLDQMITRGKEAAIIVKKEFGYLGLKQLNRKPTPERWSIGQCLDHLVVSDCSYFPVLKKIAAGNYEMTTWEKWSPFNWLFGKMLVNQTQENPKNKLNAPKVFAPSSSQVDLGILERFQKHQDTLLEYLAGCKTTDIDRVHITSPVSQLVTYSLRNAITILIQHQHRHINQAVKVKQAVILNHSNIGT